MYDDAGVLLYLGVEKHLARIRMRRFIVFRATPWEERAGAKRLDSMRVC